MAAELCVDADAGLSRSQLRPAASVAAPPLSSSACLDLRALLGSVLPEPSRAELEAVYSDPAPLRIDPARLLSCLDEWESSGGEDAYERAMASFLRHLAERGSTSVAYSCTSREPHGGRRMAWIVPDYSGPTLLSRSGERKTRGNRYLLQTVPETVRPAFPAPEGHLWLDVDLRSAFPSVAAALSRDPALLADVADDAHQRAGDSMLPHELNAGKCRAIGKVANSLLLCGGTWQTLRRECALRGIHLQEHEAHAAASAWWARYPVLAEFVRAWWSRVLGTQQGVDLVRPDGTRDRWAPSELSGTAPVYEYLGPWAQRAEARQLAAYRSSLSAIWRAVESAILDRALILLRPMRDQGLRLALPLYDGALCVVRSDRAEELAEVSRAAFEQAGREAGVPTARAEVAIRETWK